MAELERRVDVAPLPTFHDFIEAKSGRSPLPLGRCIEVGLSRSRRQRHIGFALPASAAAEICLPRIFRTEANHDIAQFAHVTGKSIRQKLCLAASCRVNGATDAAYKR